MSAVESDSLPMGAPGSSLVAYMPHTGLLINDDNFLPEMREELDVINRQVESYNDELSLLRSMSAQFLKCGNQKLYSYLSGYDHLISEADASYAENALRSEYWKRVMALTDVLSVMSDEKKKEWDKQFTADRYHLPPQEIPDFTLDAVVTTVVALLNDRHQFIKDRVYAVFQSLSRQHKTNKAFGFSTRMITSGVCEGVKDKWVKLKVEFKESGLMPLSELRVICSYFRGETVKPVYDTKKMVENMVGHVGFRNWISLDGNSIRFRVYKNGSMHIDVHPDIAERLNNILAAIVPLALPAERVAHTKATLQEFPALKRCIDFHSRMQLAELDFTQNEKEWSSWTSLGYAGENADKTRQVNADVLRFLGARVTSYHVTFDYDPTEVMRFIGHMGAMPDIKSHQFYPSSARLSEYVASIIAAGEGERLLEPNIGHGDLLQCFPKSVNVTGIELDTLNCLVSRAKGYETTEADFLAWSAANQIQKFDCVVMNPPFADNRAKLHLLAAASHLVPGGRLAAVLPLSLQGIDNLLGEGFRTEWMDTFDNEFDNTAVSVRVLYAERF
ncbi:DUF4942 domain-containing protein [Escherichia coli]|nr:DUF4942 domain-containing protein [Escherichia coli]